jgi:Flp pilus assembly protein TadD
MAAFWPVVGSQFINYDDPSALLNNERLAAPGLLAWAFTTAHMGHYQPLAWLAWSQMKTLFGMNAGAFHATSLLGHVANVILLYLVSLALAAETRLSSGSRQLAALVAATSFAIHPIRVEPVAWASAFPYILALGWVLVSLLTYVRYCRSGDATSRRKWLTVSLCAYVLSLLSRVTALGFPFVLLMLDAYPLRRLARWRRLAVEKLPFFLAALLALVAESRSRELPGLADIGLGARLTMAATAPFVYLARILLPIGRTPIDPLPIEPQVEWAPLVASLAALVVISIAAWTTRQKWPAFSVTWFAFLLLLGPAAGLTPSGQQAIADRYMYVPGVAVSLFAGAVIAVIGMSSRFRQLAVPALLAIAGVLGAATWRQTRWWHDSITLWSRAADLDPRNDIATYNLAIALADAGREDEAARRFEQTLQLVPDHALARRNLMLINDARAARGIMRTQSGQFAQAVPDLRAALDARPDDPAVINALAFALVQTGNWKEAAAVLTRSLERRPQDDEIAHNLARVLATSPDRAVRDGAMALRLALAVRDRTGGRDPRVLDTLAAAYALTGQTESAVRTAAEAAALARRLGDFEMAQEIEAHVRGFTTTAASRR